MFACSLPPLGTLIKGILGSAYGHAEPRSDRPVEHSGQTLMDLTPRQGAQKLKPADNAGPWHRLDDETESMRKEGSGNKSSVSDGTIQVVGDIETHSEAGDESVQSNYIVGGGKR